MSVSSTVSSDFGSGDEKRLEEKAEEEEEAEAFEEKESDDEESSELSLEEAIQAIKQLFSDENEARQKAREERDKQKQLEKEAKQESSKKKAKKRAKEKRWKENVKKRSEEKDKQEKAKEFDETLKKFGSGHERNSEQYHDNPSGADYSTSDQSSSDEGEISKEAGSIKIFENIVAEIPKAPNEARKRIEMPKEYDTLTVIPGMPNDLARATNSLFASSHNSSDVRNCNLIMAEDKTVVLHFNQQQSSVGSEVRIDMLNVDSSQAATIMSDGPSQETKFPHGTSTLMLDGPSQQIRLANDNNNTILRDPIMVLDGPSEEIGELEMTSHGPEERINILNDNNGSTLSNDGNNSSATSSNNEVQPQETRFPNGVNNAILGITGQAMATIIAANSPGSLTVRLFAYATGIGFYGSLFAALFLRRHPNIAKTLFKIGVSASAFTVMIALGQYLPKQWYLDTSIPAVACLIIAVIVALSELD